MSYTRPRSPAFAARPLLLISLFLTTAVAMIQITPPEQYAQPAVHRRGQTYSGCYSTSKPLGNKGTWKYQSTSYCGNICTNANAAVMGLSSGDDCWCGQELPPADTKVDDSNCNTICTGYGSVDCGGTGFWSVYLTGLEASVPNSGGGSSSSSGTTTTTSTPTPASTKIAPTTSTSKSKPATTSVSPSVITSLTPGSTIVVTESPTASPSESSKSGGSTNTAGIAAGVVVAIVAVAAIIGGVYFFLRRRKRQSAEDEYKRSNQVTDFMRGAGERKGPGSGYSYGSDSRLDPEAGRRNSVGSLADNQDYSRRILRVANPDSS